MQVGKIDFHETNLPGSFKPLEQFPPTPAMMTMFAPSLRDRMAMAAIQGLLATEAQLDTPLGEEADSLAAAAYEYADAMLKAREQ